MAKASRQPADSRKRQATTIALDKLRPHPRQAELFDDLNKGSLDALVNDIQQHGLRLPIEILPNGTIVCGHQRFLAVQRLGWKNVPVIIRHDLAASGAAAVESHLIQDNLNRRQLDPLTIARCYQALRDVEKAGRKRSAKGERQDDLRDQVAAHFGRSGRMLERYCSLLELPRSIQAAVSRHELPLNSATKVLQLPVEVREAIARAIEGGAEPKAAVREQLRVGSTSVSQGNVVKRLLTAIRTAMKTLSTGPRGELASGDAAALRRGVKWLTTILGDADNRT